MFSSRILVSSVAVFFLSTTSNAAHSKEKIHLLYVGLADHYPAIVAHYNYSKKMKEADYSVEMMKSLPEMKGKFMSGQADIALLNAPMSMNMFAENPNFRWVGLAHRNGNALAVNEIFLKNMSLDEDRSKRKPDKTFSDALIKIKNNTAEPTVVGVPSIESTHTLALYKYLKDNNMTLSLRQGQGDVVAKAVPPSKSPLYITEQAKLGKAASFEQSLPWAEVVESGGYGKVVWYSKDVLKWENGHVECIIIATDYAIKNKTAALKEVISYIHQAGIDIQLAIVNQGSELDEIAEIINKNYINAHSPSVIKSSLHKDIGAINYVNLNNDVAGISMIMDLAVESGVMKKPINITEFSDMSFSTELTIEKK